MAITKIHFADISSLKVGATEILGIQSVSFQAPADVRPVFGFNNVGPIIKISSYSMSTGSFTFLNSDAQLIAQDWKTLLNGAVSIVFTGGQTSGDSGIVAGTETVTLSFALYQSKSFGMNVRGEGTTSINFAYTAGLNG